MAEFNLEDLAALFDNGTESSQKFFKETKEGMLSAGTAISGFISELEGAASSTGAITDEMQKALKSVYELKGAGETVLNFARNLKFTEDELKIFGLHVALVTSALVTGIKPDAFREVGGAAKDATASLAQTGETLEKISNIFRLLPGGEKLKGIATATKVFGELADPARQFEAGMLQAASASGELGDVLHEIGEDMSGLERKMVTFTNLTYDIANASGLSTSQVGKYAAQLMQIPGALSTTVDLTADGAEKMHMLDAAIKVAAGTGQNFEAIFRQMNHVYLEFGTTGKSALEYVSRLSAASQSLKLPLDLVRTYTEGAAQSFRYFGDNSQGAINILARFGPALKESGLGPKAIADLTQNITSNVAQMGLAQRAFVSQTAGGVGGLQGGYQIELLKKQGKVDEVQKMVEASLRKQFGGRIVTLEEGAKDQGSAAQLTKQVQLLTTGPTKIANTEGEAYRILEAMAKGGGAPATETVKPPEEALKSAVDKGNSFQERNFSALVTLTNWAEKQAQFAAISANNLTRMVSGRDNPLARRAIDEMRLDASGTAATRKMVTGSKAESPAEETLNESMLRSFKDTKGPRIFLDSIDKGFSELTARQSINNRQMAEGLAQRSGAGTRGPGASMMPPRGRVAADLRLPANNPNTPGQGTSGPRQTEATVNVLSVCPQCNAKVAEQTAIRIVDGRIVKMQKDHINHAHGSYNL
jgi:hypothetical protein